VITISSTPVVANTDEELKDIMQHLGDALLALIPVVNSREFDREAFIVNSTRMKNYLDQAGSHFESQPVNSRITYAMLSERLSEVNQLSNDNGILSARSLLSESVELCASCHAQDQKTRPGFGISRLRELDEFQAAEFSFLSRDYPSALVSYGNYLNQSPTDAYQRGLALDRVLSITTEIYADMDSAKDVLTGLKLVSDAERMRVASWLNAFRNLKDKELVLSPMRETTIGQLDQYLTSEWPAVQSFVPWHEQQAYWMLIRRKLNNLLLDNPSRDEMPVLLYWLAVADRSTHFQFYESLSRRYLDRCVREFPTHPYAKKCFDEFELLMIVSFSGSGGINMPVEIREEINDLRKIIFQ
jgi:hypothetical protein